MVSIIRAMPWDKQKSSSDGIRSTFVRSKGRNIAQSEFTMRLNSHLMRDIGWDEAVELASSETRRTYPDFSPEYLPSLSQ